MKISEFIKVLEFVKSREGDLNIVDVKPGVITKFSFEMWTDIFENATGETLMYI